MTQSDRTGSLPLITAIFLSLVLHVAYLFWADPKEPVRNAPHKPTSGMQLVSFSTSGLKGQNPTRDALKLYSPAVFAFPTPVGFSGSVLYQTLRSPPPRMSRSIADSGLRLNQRSRMLTEEPSFASDDRQQRSHPSLKHLPNTHSQNVSQPPFGISTKGAPSFTHRAPDSWPAPTLLPEGYWAGSITVSLNKNGTVQRALVRPSAGSNSESMLWARWAYGLIFAAGESSETGQLNVQWIPPGTHESSVP